MTTTTHTNCQHSERFAELYCGSYFVNCNNCKETLITIPFNSAESLLKGHLIVSRTESPNREKVAEGPAEHLVPHIRQLLMHNERLSLSGSNAVISVSLLGYIKNNSLQIQLEYFTRALAENPHDESVPFSLAQILRELGEDQKANEYYDAGIKTANTKWLRKLPFFTLPSIIVAMVMWQQSIAPWLAIVVALTGPVVWFFIRHNRQRWLPIVGFDLRSETAAKIDMKATLKSESRPK